MSKELIISKTLALPLEAVTQTFAIVARKRVGKTYTASVMAEEFIRNKVPIVVLDPTGAWWGLRSSADGRADGYPVIIIGGSHADVPLDEHAGKIIADLVVDHPGYYVIDFSGTESEAAQDRFATEFGQHFYRRKESAKFPMHLFVDEADCFMPQRPFPGQQRMLGAFDTIVRRGGIRGIGVTMITQRPAVLNKNALTQAETLIALQISGAQDVDALEHWVNRHGTKEQRAVFLNSLATLQRGECWVWSPSWLETFERVTIRERVTFNSSATPKVGEKVIIAPKLASVDIAALGERIKSAAENIKANDPAALKAEIKRLNAEAQRLQRDAEKKPAASSEPKVKNVSQPILVETELHHIKLAIKTFREQADILQAVAAAHAAIKPVVDKLESEIAQFTVLTGKNKNHWALPQPTESALAHPVLRRFVGKVADSGAIRTGSVRALENAAGGSPAPALPQGEESILRACIQFPEGVNRQQLTVLTQYKRSTRDTYIQRLREKGLVEVGANDRVMATLDGSAAIPDAEALPTGEALQQVWLHKLPEGERRIFELLLSAYPEAVSREDLTARTDYKRSTRDTYLQRMSAKMLFTEPNRGYVRASDNLFS